MMQTQLLRKRQLNANLFVFASMQAYIYAALAKILPSNSYSPYYFGQPKLYFRRRPKYLSNICTIGIRQDNAKNYDLKYLLRLNELPPITKFYAKKVKQGFLIIKSMHAAVWNRKLYLYRLMFRNQKLKIKNPGI
jgi:hypothetical protein